MLTVFLEIQENLPIPEKKFEFLAYNFKLPELVA